MGLQEAAKIVDWWECKNFPCPFIKQMKATEYYCVICDCTLLRGSQHMHEHVRGLRHSCATEEHGFYILPLDDNSYYCKCCKAIIPDDYRVNSHITSKSHRSFMSHNAQERLKKPTVWSTSNYFAAPFVSLENTDEFYCLLCNSTIIGKTKYEDHVRHKTHLGALMHYSRQISPLDHDYYHCTVCDFVIPSYTNIHAHLMGRKHRSVIEIPIDWNKSKNFVRPFVYPESDGNFYCMICSCTTGSRSSIEAHFIGLKSHRAVVKRALEHIIPLANGFYHCTVCDCMIPNYTMVASHFGENMDKNSLYMVEKKKTDKLPKSINWSESEYFVYPFVSQEDNEEFYCILCNEFITGSKDLETHVSADSHQAVLKRDGSYITPMENDSYHCNICDSSVDRYTSVHMHLQGKRHLYLIRLDQKNNFGESRTLVDKTEREKRGNEEKSKRFADDKKMRGYNNGPQTFEENFSDKDIINHYNVQECENDSFSAFSAEKRSCENLDLSFDYNASVQTRTSDYVIKICKRKELKKFDEHTNLLSPIDLNILHSTKVENYSLCNYSLENENITTSKKTTILDEISSMGKLDKLFSLISRELSMLLVQLRKEEPIYEKDPSSGTILDKRSLLMKQSSSCGTVASGLETLISWTKDLSEKSIESMTDVSEKNGKFLCNVESQTSTKIGKSSGNDLNSGFNSSLTNGNVTTPDSGNEDSSPLSSTSNTSNYLDAKQPRRKTDMENAIDLLDFETNIYDTQERSKKIALSKELYFLTDNEYDYCFVCQKMAPHSVNKYLEHFWSSEHQNYLEKMIDEYWQFDMTSRHLSQLSRALEYIEVKSGKLTLCRVCDEEISNNNCAIQNHIDNDYHEENRENMRAKIMAHFDTSESGIYCDWYNVHKWTCTLCTKHFVYEIGFFEHLKSEQHTNMMMKPPTNDNELIYDFCALCSELWCAFRSVQINHCSISTHKWFMRNGPYVSLELPKLATELLALSENYDHMHNDDMEEILTCCRDSINGAIENGLLGLFSDLSFGGQPAINDDIKLIKLFSNIFPSSRKLLSFLKQWLISCELSEGSHPISIHALYWYMIFYLQTQLILPSIAVLKSIKMLWHMITECEDTNGGLINSQAENNISFKQLLVGFFSFYANFDYRYDVACPLLGKVMNKRSFVELDYLPEEMRPYMHYMRNSTYPVPFRIDSVMCIQDPLNIQHNLTQFVSKVDLSRFRMFCCKSLDVLYSS